MEQLHARCAGLDVHQATVVACALIDEGKRTPRKEIRTFGTMHAELLELREWLRRLGITHVAMEGTGVYWRPVYSVLEGDVDLTVANATHIKNVPGRKTDVVDAQWIATLLRFGLLRKSFVPSKDIREIRELTRYRRKLVQAETAEKNRIVKLLEIAGIKLASVASDVFGKSGMLMLQALVEGDKTAPEMAASACGRMRSKIPALTQALNVTVDDHHRLLLRKQLRRLTATQGEVADLDKHIGKRVAPYAEQLALLCTIDGIDEVAAREIFAETGPDLSTFEHERAFAAWSGLCPGMRQSAGKDRSARRRRGNRHLQGILVESAFAASRKKNTYLADKHRRLKARRGPLRALFAIAHKIGCAVFRVLKTRVAYKDLGANYLDSRDRSRTARSLILRLKTLGYAVSLLPPRSEPEGSPAPA